MRQILVFIGFWIGIAGAQTPQPVAQNRVIGEVTALDAAARRMSVKTDSGNTVSILLDDKTTYLRVPPGEKDLKQAVKITLADITAGDRVFARGKLSDGEQTMPATSVIVMTKADLAAKHEHDRAEWQKRGTAGTVAALDPATKQITLTVRTPEGTKPIIIEAADNIPFRRYAPDSVKFSDAKPSSFAELKVGDHLRVLGDKNAEGSRIKPEEIVSGAFRNVAGTVISADASTGEIKITDLQTKKPLLVKVNSDSTLRRVPPMMAMMMTQRRQAGASGPGGAENRVPGGGPPQGIPRAHANGDVQQMLERMPPLSISELKAGDAVIVSSTAGVEPTRLTAITLVAGVEPFLTAAPQGGQQVGSAWNFDIGMPAN
jgi:hypothetical protein